MVDEIYSFESMKTAEPIKCNSFSSQVMQNLAWLDRIGRHARLKIQGDITVKDFMAVYCLFQQAALDEPKWNKSFKPDIQN